MKAVILAGGLGTRLSEETDVKPKPMVEIGGKPILWHIMKIYSHYGINDFIICTGYKSYLIKEYFYHYFIHQTDLTVDLKKNCIEYHQSNTEPWKVTVVDTGVNTMTGGRIKRIQKYIGDNRFLMTYGDGVSNVDIKSLMSYHDSKKSFVTLTAVQPSGKFGALDLDNEGFVNSFLEKPKGDGAWVNGGFFVLEPEIFDYIKNGDSSIWEADPLTKLAADGKLSAYKHNGFWKPMDTLKDKMDLESLWNSRSAPWRVWE